MTTFEVKAEWSSDGAKVADSNMALVGSDMDKDARLAAAEGEPAWAGCGQTAGIEIWRVEKMKIVPWPKEEYGSFYSGDSYIVLKTTEAPDGDKLTWDIHFWLGTETSQDEMGVAAYKTVELDDLMNQAPIQHREVMLHESIQFTQLFPTMKYMSGGIDSGFAHVEAGTYLPKLMLIRKLLKSVKVLEVPCKTSSLNTGDCFVLDTGSVIYPWYGDESSAFEKAKAGTVVANLQNERAGKSSVCNEPDAAFWEALGGEGPITPCNEALARIPMELGEGILFCLSDDSGKLMCTEVGRGDLTRSMLSSDNVYILDVGNELFVMVGNQATDAERRNAMSTAVSYLGTQNKPLHTAIHLLNEEQAWNNAQWAKIFSN